MVHPEKRGVSTASAVAAVIVVVLVGAVGLYVLAQTPTKGTTVTLSGSSTTTGSGTPASSQTTQSQSMAAVVYIKGNGCYDNICYYDPPSITVIIGINNSVTWTNDDTIAHTVTDPRVFDSGDMGPSSTWTYTFTSPGVYNYYCTYHTWMTATVMVKSSP